MIKPSAAVLDLITAGAVVGRAAGQNIGSRKTSYRQEKSHADPLGLPVWACISICFTSYLFLSWIPLPTNSPTLSCLDTRQPGRLSQEP